MKDLSANTVLAGVELVILGFLGAAMIVEPIPSVNSTILGMIVGALAGALTVGGSSKVADKLTTSSGPGAVIQPEAPTPSEPAGAVS